MLIRVFYRELNNSSDVLNFNKKHSHYNYLVNVLRLKPKDNLNIFNENSEKKFIVDSISNKEIVLNFSHTIDKNFNTELKNLAIIVPFIKPDKIIKLTKQIVEIGIHRIIFCKMKNSSVNEINLDRINANIIEALEQSRGNKMPEVDIVKNLTEALKMIEDYSILYGACSEFQEDFSKSTDIRFMKICTICGPEGGFHKEEINLLKNQFNSVPIKIGNRIMRTETASIALIIKALILLEI